MTNIRRFWLRWFFIAVVVLLAIIAVEGFVIVRILTRPVPGGWTIYPPLSVPSDTE